MNLTFSPARFKQILDNGNINSKGRFADVFNYRISSGYAIYTQAHFDILIDYMISNKNVIFLQYINNLNNFEMIYRDNKISTEKFTEIVNIWKIISNKEIPPLWYIPFLITKYKFNEEQLNIINQYPFLLKLYTIFTKDILSNEDVIYLIEWSNPSRIIQMDNMCGIYSDTVLVALIEKLTELRDTREDVNAKIVTLCTKIQLEKYDDVLKYYLDSNNPLLNTMALLVNIFKLEITTEDLHMMRKRRYYSAIIWSIASKKAKYDYVIYKEIYPEIRNTLRDHGDSIKNCAGDNIIINHDSFIQNNYYFVNDNISEILYFIDIGEPDKATEFINKNNIQITYEYIYDKYICGILPYTGHHMPILLFFLQYKIIFDKKMFIEYTKNIKKLTYDIFLVFNNNGMVFDLEIFETLCICKIIIDNLDSRELNLQTALNICDKYIFHPPEYSYIFYNNKELYDKYICSSQTNLQFIKENIEIYTDELVIRLYKYNTKIYDKLYLLNKIKPPLAIFLYKSNLKKSDRQIILDTIKNNGLYLPAEFAS
jgi:hypothetical protein